MDEYEARTFVNKVDALFRDFDYHEVSYDYDCFAGITARELAQIAKKLITEYSFNPDDFYVSTIDTWYEHGSIMQEGITI